MSTRSAGNQWTAADVPDQSGRTAVITGANSGLGFEVARVLAERGATVVLACRDTDRAGRAADRIRADTPNADIRITQLDLASLDSVRAAAEHLGDDHPRIDLLINNAGLMMPPYGRTEDGFELQFGINHLGHFALTGLLLDRLVTVPGSRIVTISSNAHKGGRINFDDLGSDERYRRTAAYAQSKLANLLFTYELQRRLAEAGAETIAVAAHPGGSRTELTRNTPRPLRPATRVLMRIMGQSAAMGALPTLRAAVDAAVRGGDYYGPDGRSEQTGYPKLVESNARSHDSADQRRLWIESQRLTNVSYPFGIRTS
ncbi:MAG TPA: SDR family NAD(P)-dependent oxidoreductase [Pseudonocardiaceae bacterium]|jgi:NAD(P)-dependent dehydrogenase (short-subunit alcohol dehydrogenase family)|nr:SDR family NAD(P)-dependent oxidoreductase [Pseudonocardiaceae bacterium]